MKLTLFHYVIFHLFFFINMPLSAQEVLPLTEQEAIETGLKNNKVLKSLYYKTVAAEAKYNEAGTYSLPSLKFQASYTRLSKIDPFKITVPMLGSFVLNPSLPDNYGMKVSLQQPLFTGFKISSGTDAAKYMNISAAAEYESEVRNTKLQIQTAYWNLRKAELMKKVMEEALVNLNSRVKDAENLFKQGMITKNDLLKIQVQQSDIRYRLIEVSDAEIFANTYLSTILGLEKNPKIAPTDEISGIENIPLSADELIEHAVTQRTDIKAHQFRIYAAREQITIAQSAWYPQLFLAGNYMYAKPNQRYFPAENKFQDSWDVSVVISYDIWNWLAPLYVTEQAEANLSTAEESMNAMKDGIKLEVIQSYLQIQQAVEKHKVAKLGLEQAEENLQLTESKFREGMSLSSDLIDAESYLIQAKVNYTNSIIDYKLSYARLMKAAGK
ncbi:MAG: TolC family protein [Ignavibacteriaceae bacterium]|nr:TolC family protein [Ignavibacteriaceae bacterium]